MSEQLEGIDRAGAAPDDAAEEQRPSRWTRTHTIWTLISLSLLPGVLVALFQGHWLELPPGVRATAILLSAVLVIAACSLIFAGDDKRD
ncbi:MAG TPA: hypothetical protein VIG08_10885 [Gemmatimonadales bacterium]|jgi:hypothetical protein